MGPTEAALLPCPHPKMGLHEQGPLPLPLWLRFCCVDGLSSPCMAERCTNVPAPTTEQPFLRKNQACHCLRCVHALLLTTLPVTKQSIWWLTADQARQLD